MELIPLTVIQLHVNKCEFLLQSRDLTLRDVLIESLLGHELAPQVLNLKGELSLDGCVFFPHDVSPNQVELIEDLRDASLRHLAIELALELLDLLDSLGGDPFVGISRVLVLSGVPFLASLDAEGAADHSDVLLGKILCFPQDLNVVEILIVASILQELDESFTVTFHVIEFHMD